VKILDIIEHLEVNENNHLTLHGVDLVSLCEKYGTPLFVFDEIMLVENFERFRRAFESLYSKVMVCYSVKTNNNLAICKILREKGAYAEVSSGLDLHVALKAGFPGEKIIFDGPFKPKEILKKAIEEGVLLINVESFTEMKRLNSLAGKMGVNQAVGIRVSTFKDLGFSKYFSLINLVNAAYCNLDSRFGFPMDEVHAVFENALNLKNLRVEGIMAHPYRNATNVLLPLMQELYERFQIEIRYLNLGGGFHPGGTRFIGSKELIFDFLRRKVGLKSKFRKWDKASPIELVAKSVVDKIRMCLGNLEEPELIVEPGRFITSSAGILLVRIDHVKRAGGYIWAVVDGGTNLVPRFSAVELRKVVVANKASNEAEEEVNIVGPLLYSDDFITLKAFLPKVCEGDILSIFDCGAYTLSRSNQFLYPRPAAILLNGSGEVKIIREKETYEDVLYKDRDV
jgi:diaminopimelate decarboxylase